MIDNSAIPKKTMDFFDDDQLRARVFTDKYALRDKDGKMLEKTPPQMWKRVAKEIARVDRQLGGGF